MLKTPPGVAWPFEPVLTVERPMRMPLRYTCMICSGTLTSTMSGPLGESCGFHQYSPGLSAPRRFAGRRAFGVRGRFFHRLRGGEQGGGEGEDAEEFHEVWLRGKSCRGRSPESLRQWNRTFVSCGESCGPGRASVTSSARHLKKGKINVALLRSDAVGLHSVPESCQPAQISL